MNKYVVFSVIGLAVVALTASGALAYQGDVSVQGSNYTLERHEAMLDAFADNDYSAWQDLHNSSNGKIKDVVNEDNFSQFVTMHNAMLGGDTATADAIRAELGLGQGQMKRGDNGQGQGTRGSRSRGLNAGGYFVDADGNGVCDRME